MFNASGESLSESAGICDPGRGLTARFDTGPDSSRVTAGFRNRALEPVMTVRFVGAAAKLAHAASIAACPVHPDQSGRYAPPHGSRRLADE